jgi:hypothetical protein
MRCLPRAYALGSFTVGASLLKKLASVGAFNGTGICWNFRGDCSVISGDSFHPMTFLCDLCDLCGKELFSSPLQLLAGSEAHAEFCLEALQRFQDKAIAHAFGVAQ